MDALAPYVDVSRTSLFLSLGAIAFNPTAWNIVARNEYHNKTIAPIFGGNAYAGTYFLAAWIFGCGILRDQLRKLPYFLSRSTLILVALFGLGQLFVVTSTWALGITGTFLWDYFGILMDARVEGFPSNVLRDPMYVGSTLCFAVTALWHERPTGLLITLYVYIVYILALEYEGPFTDMIDSSRASAQAAASNKPSSKKEL
ncbi:unnamed protein product [Peniophora sp. CBMAI 1063]|nr:unnamed protein product [Peniophora sp. CBMAI 1063]